MQNKFVKKQPTKTKDLICILSTNYNNPLQIYRKQSALDALLVSTIPLYANKLYYLLVTSTQTFETCVSREESNSYPK